MSRPPAASSATRSSTSATNSEYHIVEETSDPEGVGKEILGELLRFNEAQAGELNLQRFVLTVRAPEGALLGGLVAMQYWNGMLIDYLWVQQRLRGRGIGRELVRRAEHALRARGGEIVFLSTWSFQAPRFYERLGYTAFGTLEGIPPGGSRTWYAKRLGRAR